MALEQKKVKIDGKEYTFQKLPIRTYYDFMNKLKRGEFGIVESYDYLLEHVVVNPRLTLEDFETEGVAHCEKVMTEANKFLTAKSKI